MHFLKVCFPSLFFLHLCKSTHGDAILLLLWSTITLKLVSSAKDHMNVAWVIGSAVSSLCPKCISICTWSSPPVTGTLRIDDGFTWAGVQKQAVLYTQSSISCQSIICLLQSKYTKKKTCTHYNMRCQSTSWQLSMPREKESKWKMASLTFVVAAAAPHFGL